MMRIVSSKTQDESLLTAAGYDVQGSGSAAPSTTLEPAPPTEETDARGTAQRGLATKTRDCKVLLCKSCIE